MIRASLVLLLGAMILAGVTASAARIPLNAGTLQAMRIEVGSMGHTPTECEGRALHVRAAGLQGAGGKLLGANVSVQCDANSPVHHAGPQLSSLPATASPSASVTAISPTAPATTTATVTATTTGTATIPRPASSTPTAVPPPPTETSNPAATATPRAH